MYVDAIHDKKSDQILVVERKNGERIYREYPARYTFYYSDPKGRFRSINGDPVTRVLCKNTKTFKKERASVSHNALFESDVSPVNQCLSENYLNSPVPDLHIGFWDIETDFCPVRGYATPDDPFLPITSITIYLKWIKSMITLVVPPETVSNEEMSRLEEKWNGMVVFFNTEVDMLTAFLKVIDDVDVLSGWNCTTYDIPYTINRIARVMSKGDTRAMCLWNQFPKTRSFELYGKEQKTYDLCGRVNLDYLELYKKYTYEERSSYKLDSIGEIELDERKTEYEGTLDQLYKNDFELFITYNRQDVALLDKLDNKFEFINLTISSAHENTVLMPATMGSVAIIEQGIINEAHLNNVVVPDKKRSAEVSHSIAGGFVGIPKKGIHDWIGSIDLNSLYPSAIRALNMGNETIIGQIRQERTEESIRKVIESGHNYNQAWDGKFSCVEYDIVMDQRNDLNIIIDWENGRSEEMSGAQAYKLIFDSNKPWMLSANGTIFTYEKRGIIPDLLTKWYSERKQMQKQKKNWQKLKEGLEIPSRLL